jgi:hypothetical protein
MLRRIELHQVDRVGSMSLVMCRGPGAMTRRYEFNLRWTKRVLAWTVLIAITLLLGSQFQALVATAFAPTGPALLPDECRAALSTGHDQRESFLARSQ